METLVNPVTPKHAKMQRLAYPANIFLKIWFFLQLLFIYLIKGRQSNLANRMLSNYCATVCTCSDSARAGHNAKSMV